MKDSGILLLGITTLVLVFLTIFASLGFPFGFLFYLMVFGQALLLLTVYKVLTGERRSQKTFKDFYEDYSPDSDD